MVFHTPNVSLYFWENLSRSFKKIFLTGAKKEEIWVLVTLKFQKFCLCRN